MAPSVAVIGCGVIGATTALRILETDPSIRLTILADTFTPDNTTDGAAGLLMPFAAGETTNDLVRKWFGATMKKFEELLNSELADQLGLFRTSGYFVADYSLEEPSWRDQVYGFRELSDEELTAFPLPAKRGFFFSTIFAQGKCYMPWLMKRIQDLGGQIVKKRINSLAEIADQYDVVVNCTGLRAKELVNDPDMYPIRGQIIRVKAPWVKQFYLYVNSEHEKVGRLNDILPQVDQIVLGGCEQVGSYNNKPTVQDTINILEDTTKLMPSLKHAVIDDIWTGLRPGRKAVRLEKEVMKFINKAGHEVALKVVHNYGHGGSGPSLSFGCAADCCDLVFEFLARDTKSKL